jgi:hypothetical protein
MLGLPDKPGSLASDHRIIGDMTLVTTNRLYYKQFVSAMAAATVAITHRKPCPAAHRPHTLVRLRRPGIV